MYQICKSDVEIDDVKYQTYGISYEDKKITDITTDKKKIEQLIETVNRLNVSPLHIRDIIDDFILDIN